jgi:hypothetical protein
LGRSPVAGLISAAITRICSPKVRAFLSDCLRHRSPTGSPSPPRQYDQREGHLGAAAATDTPRPAAWVLRRFVPALHQCRSPESTYSAARRHKPGCACRSRQKESALACCTGSGGQVPDLRGWLHPFRCCCGDVSRTASSPAWTCPGRRPSCFPPGRGGRTP